MFNDVEALEMNPHRMSGIRKPPMLESIRDQQMRKFILDGGFRNRRDGKDGQASCKGDYSNKNDSESLALRNSRELDFDRSEGRGECFRFPDGTNKGEKS